EFYALSPTLWKCLKCTFVYPIALHQCPVCATSIRRLDKQFTNSSDYAVGCPCGFAFYQSSDGNARKGCRVEVVQCKDCKQQSVTGEDLSQDNNDSIRGHQHDWIHQRWACPYCLADNTAKFCL